MNDAIIPDAAEFVRSTVKELDKSKEVDNTSQATSLDQLWAALIKYNSWNKALKPYLEDRIKVMKNMTEINFDGQETAGEIGIRYLICSGIGKELQDIIDKVEQTSAVLASMKK